MARQEICVGKARNENDNSDDKAEAIKEEKGGKRECLNDCLKQSFTVVEAAK